MNGTEKYDVTPAQAFGIDAERNVKTVADELERLAARLRWVAAALPRGDGRASQVAAEIVNDYVQGTGNAGGRLWGVVRNSGQADAEFHKAAGGAS